MSQTLKQILDYTLNLSTQDVINLGFPIPLEIYNQSIGFLQEYFFDSDNFLDNNIDEELTEELWDSMLCHIFDGIVIEDMQSFGGEGKGDAYYTIYKFTKESTGEEEYVKFDGWYTSYQGASYSRYFFVQPSQRLVTFYS